MIVYNHYINYLLKSSTQRIRITERMVSIDIVNTHPKIPTLAEETIDDQREY